MERPISQTIPRTPYTRRRVYGVRGIVLHLTSASPPPPRPVYKPIHLRPVPCPLYNQVRDVGTAQKILNPSS